MDPIISDIWENACRTGDKAPNVTLPDLAGAPHSLGNFWAKGPLVLIIHPGRSCGYCALQLRKWRAYRHAMVQLGATVAVVCLQDPDGPLDAVAESTLRDTDMHAAYAFGIAVPLPREGAGLYTSIGLGVPVQNGSGQWVLPTAATYLVDQDGRILFAHLAADQGHAEPRDLVAVIHGLRPRAFAPCWNSQALQAA